MSEYNIVCLGIEGGIEKSQEGMEAFARVVIKSSDGRFGKGKTGTFFLPPPVQKLIEEGKELGDPKIGFKGL